MSNPIQWCDETWNVVLGCSPVSSGCDHCYAARMANRFKEPGEAFDGLIGEFNTETAGYSSGPFNGRVELKHDRTQMPFHWRKPRRIFACSMGDLFHESVDFEFIEGLLCVMDETRRHTYMVLTKRPERMLEFFHNGYGILGQNGTSPLPNLWIGVSVEDQKTADERIPLLIKIPAAKRFISVEPMLGPVDIRQSKIDYSVPTRFSDGIGIEWTDPGDDFIGIDLAICGAETGPYKRQMNLDWARSLRDQCKAANVHFWFKKDSDKKETLDGVIHHPGFWR